MPVWFESRPDAIGTEKAVEMLALVLLLIKMPLLTAQKQVGCGWYAGRESASHGAMVLARL